MQLEAERLGVPVAVIDIGGRTTDFVVVADQAVRHDSSVRCVVVCWTSNARSRPPSAQSSTSRSCPSARPRMPCVAAASACSARRTTFAEIVRDARRELVQRLHAETQRQLGRGAELERILFVGGGAVALAGHGDWFPNQTIAPHPAFANARGCWYLRYVCQEPT